MIKQENKQLRIAVNTPRGNVGKHVVSMLLKAGVKPLLLDRNPEKIPVEVKQRCDIVRADSASAQEVVSATRNVDAIYWVDPSVYSTEPLAEYAKFTDALVEAVRSNEISRVVFQSSVGAEKRHGAGEIDGLAATEVALDKTNADVTHLRCGYFFSNLLLDIDSVRQGHLRTVLPLDQPMSWVAPRDIAEVAALRLLNQDWSGRNVQAVHGPENLTWGQVSVILSDATGREIDVTRVSDVFMREQFLSAGMPPKMADAVLQMSSGLRDNYEPEQARTYITTTHTRLESWVREHLLPAL